MLIAIIIIVVLVVAIIGLYNNLVVARQKVRNACSITKKIRFNS